MNAPVFQLWQTIEALTPIEAMRINYSDKRSPVYGVAPHAAMPWDDPSHKRKPIDAGWQWFHYAQCAIYSTDEVSRLLVAAISGSDGQWQENTGGTSRLFDLSFDELGHPQPHSFSLSMAAWASGQLLRTKGDVALFLAGGNPDLKGLPVPADDLPVTSSGFEAFDLLSRALMQLVSDRGEELRVDGRAANVKWIMDLSSLVAESLGLPTSVFDKSTPIRVRSIQMKASRKESVAEAKNEGAEILNSFFCEDLRRIESSFNAGKAGKGLLQYISGGTGRHAVERLDVRSYDNLEMFHDTILPERFPQGRWPSNHALVFSQQVGVNEAIGTLTNDAGLFAINGPPGTGKTTLLRDVVAAVVTQRAVQMVRSRTKKFADKQVLKLANASLPYYPLHESLQGFAIVAASSNNGAVENISLELPGLQAVPSRVERAYYPELAESVTGKAAWGLLAAALGKSENRKKFLNRFWWGKSGVTQPDSEKASSLRDVLRSILQGSAQPAISWDDAVAKFKTAQEREEKIREQVLALSKLPENVAHITLRLESDSVAFERVSQQLKDRSISAFEQSEKVSSLAKAARVAIDTHERADAEHKAHIKAKPGILVWLSTFGRASREWWAMSNELHLSNQRARNAAIERQAELDAASAELMRLNASVRSLTSRQQELHDAIEEAQASLEQHEKRLQAGLEALGSNWPQLDAEPDTRERSSPWAFPAWMKAREDVFLAALVVHRAFIESHPVQMIANLGLASDWLNGKPLPPDVTKLAMESLCLVVPVISTTFASVPRMFNGITSNSIGWLLIDEAGQANPSHAVSAIWRARRTIVVGDPRQLEPVTVLPQAIENALATHFKIEEGLLPSRVSAQSLADRSARIGTWLPDDGGKTWVGCPLRLHRRCDQPMFSISNTIAYGGMMVHGKGAPALSPLPQSAWYDVQATSSSGHWIAAEEAQLRYLLSEIVSLGTPTHEIAMISPFRDCAQNLRGVAREFGIDCGKVGTVHTSQGKEADVVFLVLGGDPRLPGAKAWAASKPNLLNVANSRAKKRLYVIGNLSLWGKLDYFSVLAEFLPVAFTSAREAPGFSPGLRALTPQAS